ncbi:MAG: hypothetical protein ACK5NK_07805 [Niabella sp.]
MKKIILIIALSSLLLGCDPSSDFRKIFHNNSKNQIGVVWYSNSNTGIMTPVDTIIINPNKTETIFSGSGIGGFWTNKDCANPYNVDSIEAIVLDNQSLKLSIDINKSDAWSFTEKGNSTKGYIMQCFITITNADIIHK